MTVNRTALLVLLFAMSTASYSPAFGSGKITDEFEIDRVWSVHRTASPVLLTGGGYQYVVYYDAERQLTLAQRKPGERNWRYERFPVRTRWATGGHAVIGMALDGDGHLHLVPYRRDLSELPPLPYSMIYFRTQRAHDLDSLEQIYMVAPDEPNPGYPTFITGPDGRLYFEFRIGGSGAGSQRWNVYDLESRSWTSLPVFLDGRGQMSAYGGPRMGPDGVWHCLWMWRDTPHAETNHTLSHMISPDLLNWKTLGGEKVDLPVTSDNPEVVVDPLKPGEGLINMVQSLGWDSALRPVIAYHKYDEEGNSQVFNARFEDGHWKRVAATDWNFRWNFQGTGALPAEVRAGGVRADGNGRLIQRVWAEPHGNLRIVLDEETLRPLETSPAEDHADTAIPAWRRGRIQPESDFDHRPMSVIWIGDRGSSGESGVHYELRWEVGPGNRDRPVPEPWPEPTILRLFRIER